MSRWVGGPYYAHAHKQTPSVLSPNTLHHLTSAPRWHYCRHRRRHHCCLRPLRPQARPKTHDEAPASWEPPAPSSSPSSTTPSSSETSPFGPPPPPRAPPGAPLLQPYSTWPTARSADPQQQPVIAQPGQSHPKAQQSTRSCPCRGKLSVGARPTSGSGSRGRQRWRRLSGPWELSWMPRKGWSLLAAAEFVGMRDARVNKCRRRGVETGAKQGASLESLQRRIMHPQISSLDYLLLTSS